MVLAYVVARALQTVGVWATAVLIAVVDVLLPSLVRLFCCLERHHNAVTHDLSIMNKVSFCFSPLTKKNVPGSRYNSLGATVGHALVLVCMKFGVDCALM